MPSRSDDPRRDTEVSRRGSSRSGADSGSTGGPSSGSTSGAGKRDGSRSRDAGLDGISDARAYTPRGRTVRDAPELRRTPRTSRSGDPFRPALQVLDGGRAGGTRAGRREPASGTTQGKAADRSASGTRSAATGRGADAAKGTAAGGTRAGAAAAGSGRTAAARAERGGELSRSAATRRRPATGSGTGRRPANSEGRRSSQGDGRSAGRPATNPAGRRPIRKKRLAPPRLADPGRRLRIGTLLVLALFATIGIRLVALQLVDAPAYAGGGVAGRTRTVTLPAPRGAIYDRTGAALAHSTAAKYVYADPQEVADPEAAAAALSPLLGISRSALTERMQEQRHPDGTPSRFEYLARQVEIEVADQITALNLAGIGVKDDERREVPGGDLAANLLGFVGEDMTGLEGIEARYDELLRGVNGKHVYEFNRGDMVTPIPGGYSEITEAQPGSSLQLTIDRDLQFDVQRRLSNMMKGVAGGTGAVVVLDLNGEILAQASHPTYNAADWAKSDWSDREDAATSFVVDPGSVHKPIVFGAALEEGVITPETAFGVPSTIRKGDTTFSDTHPVNGRKMSVAGMLGYSSNVGTIKIADALTPQKLYDYQLKFGLGTATGAGVPGEASGRVLKPQEWSGSANGSVPIGHSVDVTPMQMAAVYATIANDGVWVQPHLVRETIDPDGGRTPAPAPETRRVISAENAVALRTMMEAVVTLPDGTGTKAAIAGYRVAGKTGTGARIVDGRYVSGEVASFIGMAPADKPRYIVAVFAHTPSGGGGEIAAPAFSEMMGFTLTHYRVPPTGAQPPEFVVFPR